MKHSGMKEERCIFSAGITARFLMFFPALLSGGPTMFFFLNGFGGSSSLSCFLGPCLNVLIPFPTPLLQFCGFHNLWYPATRMHPSIYLSVFGTLGWFLTISRQCFVSKTFVQF